MSELTSDDDEETVNLASVAIGLVVVREKASFCVGSSLPTVS